MKRITIILLVSISILRVEAQVGINNPLPDSTSILDLTSNKLGLLVPRMTTFSRKAIAAPANALLVYDTDDAMFYFYDATHGGVAPSNWTGLSPFRFRDDESNWNGSLYKRDIYTHASVRYFGIGTGAPKSTLSVVGNLTVGTNAVAAPANGAVIDGQVEMKSSLTVTDTVRAAVLEGFGSIPVGGIIMWSGDPNTLPAEWRLCNGIGGYTDAFGVARGIPDLKGRFVVGYDDDSGTLPYVSKVENYGTVGNTGGETAHSLSSAEMPPHVHNMTHNHTITDPGHTHSIDLDDGNGGGGVDDASNSNEGSDNTGSNTTGITIDNFIGNTQSTGGTSGTVVSHENRPEYYVVAYIIRIQ